MNMSSVQPYSEPVWMDVARRELGVREVRGKQDNPRIIQYLRSTRYRPAVYHDEIPWCSAFVCWVLEASGIRSTRSAAAISYESFGDALDAPQPGALIVTMRQDRRNPRARHVGFWESPGRLLGGNQGNRVSVKDFDESTITAIRWPRFS